MKRVFPYSGGFLGATVVKPGFGELALSNRGGLINRLLCMLPIMAVDNFQKRVGAYCKYVLSCRPRCLWLKKGLRFALVFQCCILFGNLRSTSVLHQAAFEVLALVCPYHLGCKQRGLVKHRLHMTPHLLPCSRVASGILCFASSRDISVKLVPLACGIRVIYKYTVA